MKTTRFLAPLFAFLGLLFSHDAGAITLTTTNIMAAAPTAWTNAIWKTNLTDAFTTAVAPVAGNAYVAIDNGVQLVANGNQTRLRNPAVDGNNVFPGDSLTLKTNSEIRFKKGSTSGVTFPFISPTINTFPGVGGNPGLILNGGMLESGDDATFPIAGNIQVLTDSIIAISDGGIGAPTPNRGFQITGALTGTGSILFLQAVTNFANLEITGVNNTYSGTWNVKAGWLKGTGSNSLGSGNINLDTNYTVSTGLMTAGAVAGLSNGPVRFEVNYNIDTPGTLTVASGDAQVVLHQDCRFARVFVDGAQIPNGTYSYATIAGLYPNHVVPGGSGSISVGPATPTALTALPGDGQVRLTWGGSSGATGYVIYQSLATGLSTNATPIFTNGTGTSYTNTGLANGTQYFYVVSEINAGGESTNSVEANATPGQFAPVIAVDVVGSTNCTGTSASFSVLATNTYPVVYQWYYNTNTLLTSQTNATYTTNNVQLANIGTYSVVITNNFGSVTSSFAPLLVKISTVASTPANTTNCPGSSATFTTVATGAGTLTYTWRKGAAVVQGPDGNSSYTIASPVAADSGQYSVTVIGDCNTISNSFNFIAIPAPVITAQPQDRTTPMGNGAVFSVTALTTNGLVAPLTYQWKTNGVNVTGATTTSLAISNLPYAMNGTLVSVLVSNCGGTTLSSSSVLTVTPVFGVSLDFNSPGQFTNAPYNLVDNDWLHSGLVSPPLVSYGPVVPFEVSTGGVGVATGGGGLDLMFNQANENNSLFAAGSYDFSLPGKTLTASVMVKVKVPVAANRMIQYGFITSTNVGNAVVTLVTPTGVGYMSSMLQSRVINVVNPGYQLIAIEKPAAGAAATADFTPVNTITNALATNRWYKYTAKFTSMLGTPVFAVTNFTIDASVQDMGADGITPGSVVLAANGLAQTNIDMITNKLFFCLRLFENAGADYLDNLYITSATGPIAFVQGLTNTSVLQGRAAEFRALVDGDGPYTYQWFKNGSLISGASAWKYKTPLLTSDNGAQYSVIVTGPGNSITSTSTVTVVSDDLAVLSVGSVDGGVIGLRFNQPVTPASAQNPLNYLVNGSPARSVQVWSGPLGTAGTGWNIQQGRTNGTEVLIVPSNQISGSFTVTVASVTSLSGTAIGAGNSATGAVLGLVNFDVDPLAAGLNVQVPTLPGFSYSFAPSQLTVVAGGHDIFGTFDGFHFVYKQVTGDFDVKVRVPYLDALRTPAKAGFNARPSLDPAAPNVGAYADPMLPGRNFIEGGTRPQYLVASVSWGNNTTCIYPNAWLRFRRVGNTFMRYSSTNGVNWLFDGQTSPFPQFPATIYLGVAANCNVGVNNLQQYSTSQYDNYGDFAGYPGAAIAITTQPAGSTVAAAAAATLTAVATLTGGGAPASAGELGYLWQRTNSGGGGGWTNMPTAGATNNILSTGALFGSDNGAQYRVIVSAPGALSVTSSVATITITDAVLPTITAANIQLGALNQIVLNFSEFVSAGTALNAANYVLTNSAGTVFGISSINFLRGDQRTVILNTSNQLLGEFYGVRISGVTDLAGNVIATTTPTFKQGGSPNANGSNGLAQAVGPVVQEFYTALAAFGGSTHDLVNNPKYSRGDIYPMGSPDFFQYSNIFGIHPTTFNSWVDNYGVRMYSYFRPPTNGVYKWFSRVDDFGEFIMNTNPVNSTLPMDMIVGVVTTAGTAGMGTISTNTPINQDPWMCMDNYTNSKYLNFSINNCGFVVVPAAGASVVNGLRIATAGDRPDRDPASYTIEGTTGDPRTNCTWTLISSGTTTLTSGANSNRLAYLPDFVFTNLAGAYTNSTFYTAYRVLFPTVRGFFATADSMQVAEVNLLGTNGVATTPVRVTPSGATIQYVTTANNAAYLQDGTHCTTNTLVGGQLYFIEFRFKEGTGGDGACLTVRNDTAAAIPAASEVLSNQFLVFPTNIARPTPIQFELYGGLTTITPVTGQFGFNGSGAGAIQDLIFATNMTNFIARVPNMYGYTKIMGWNTNRVQVNGTLDNYLGRLYAYFIPPTNGNYKFWLQVDDTAQLIMNTNAVNSTDPGGAKVIGQIINYGGTAGVNQDVTNGIFNLQGGSGAYNLVATNVHLTGGQRYYMETRWREGTGGDGVVVAVRATGDTATPGLGETIPLTWFEMATNEMRIGPVKIAAIVPTNPTVSEGAIVNFQAAGVSGFGTVQGISSDLNSIANMGFVWTKNGGGILSDQVYENQMYYVTQPLTMADNGSTITLLVSNAFSIATQQVTITVTPRVTPPVILSAVASQYGDSVLVTFDTTVDPYTSQALANYRINGLSILSAGRDDKLRNRVFLRTSPQTAGTVYTLTVNGVRDNSLAGNTMVNVSTNFSSWGFGGAGGVLVEMFTNIPNGSLDYFLASPNAIYDLPDFTYYTNVWATGLFGGDSGLPTWINYGARISGRFMPQTNGLYRFYIRGDDETRLLMNTNGPDASGKVVIARNFGAGSAAAGGFASQYQSGLPTGGDSSRIGASISPVISLTNGTAYYLEALGKEGGGSDYMVVVMRPVDPITLADIGGLPATAAAGDALSAGLFSAPGNPDIIQFNVVSAPPAVTNVVEANPVTLTLVGTTVPSSLLSSVLYTWQKQYQGVGAFTNIPGATTASYSFVAALNDSNSIYRLTISLPGQTRSFDTLLNVFVDDQPPVLISASSLDGSTVGLRFNKRLEPGFANDASAYTVDGNTPVSANVRASDPTSVLLTLSPFISADTFAVSAFVGSAAANPVFDFLFGSGNVQYLTAQDVGRVGFAPFTGTNAGTSVTLNQALPGSAWTETNASVDVVAGGYDIWNLIDGFHFDYRTVTGNFDIKTRVNRLVGADQWTKAGFMARGSTNASSRFFFMGMTPQTTPIAGQAANNFFASQYRDFDAGSPGNVQNTIPPGYPNAWVRLQRSNSVFYGFFSTNGTDYVLLSQRDTALQPGGAFPDTITVGLATASHNQPNLTNNAFAEYRDIYFPKAATITTQPSPSLIMTGIHQTVTFGGVVGTGPGPVSLQWRLNGAAISGATNSSLTIANTKVADSGFYTVVVYGDGGGQISDALQLIVTNGLPTVVNDSLTATQGTATTISSSVLLGNDSDPELDALSALWVSGVYPVTYAANFDDGLAPAGATNFGAAAVQPSGGNGNTGYLSLNPLLANTAGSMIVNELTPGKRVSAFTANFSLQVVSAGSAQPADGFSFNFGNDIADASNTVALAEQGGTATGFALCLDNYQFINSANGLPPVGAAYNTPPGGTANSSGLKVNYKGIIVAAVEINNTLRGTSNSAWNTTRFVPVSVTVTESGACTVLVDGTNVFPGLVLPAYTPARGRFAFFARTGSLTESDAIDDLSLNVRTIDTALSGQVVLSGGNITYTGPSNACGADTFYYLASDGQLNGTNVGLVNVTVVASNAPVIVTCATNRTFIVGGSCLAPLADLRGELVVSDCGVVTRGQSPAPGTALSVGTTNVVTIYVTNSGGFVASCTASVIVLDTTPPVATCPAPITAEATSAAGAVVSFTPTATDNCSVASLVANPASGSTFPIGVTTVTVTATDGSGNTNACTFTVTVRDTTAPSLNCPALPIVAEATGPGGRVVTYSVTATDAVDPSPTVTYSPASGSLFPLGSTLVTVTTYDASLNTNTCTFTMTVRDTTAPAVTCSTNITQDATNSAGNVVNFTVGAVDLVDGSPTVTATPASGSVFPIGTTTVTVKAYDFSLNTNTCTFTVTILDTIAPVVTCPSNIVVEATNAAGNVVTFTPTATDNVDPSPTVTSSPASGSVFPLGMTTVTVTAYDTGHNTNTCTFTVTVRDTTAPVISCPTNRTVVCSGTNAIATFTATATDAADPSPTVTTSPASGTSFPVGTNTVTVTAYDSHGNTNTCTFLVIVTDPASVNLTLTIAQVGANVVITWPQTCTDYVLERTSDLNPVISWSTVAAPVFPVGSNFQVTVPANTPEKYYRLRHP